MALEGEGGGEATCSAGEGLACKAYITLNVDKETFVDCNSHYCKTFCEIVLAVLVMHCQINNWYTPIFQNRLFSFIG